MIKFRAWNKQTNSYFENVTSHLVIDIESSEIYECWNGEIMNDLTDRVILEQSIEQFDMNGKVIFEGDIVEYTLRNLNKIVTGFVVSKRGGYFIMTDGHNENICLFDRPSYLIKIIGNIHENTGLLEEE